MKKGIILLVLIFTACVNLEDTGSNSGGEVKEIKRTDINVSKNYEKRNGILYIDNILANGKQEYKENIEKVYLMEYKKNIIPVVKFMGKLI